MIDRFVPGHCTKPGRGVVRKLVIFPYLQRFQECLLHNILRHLQVMYPEYTCQYGDHLSRLMTEKMIDHLLGGCMGITGIRHNYILTISRTSTDPCFSKSGKPKASSVASSRDSALMI